MSSVSRSSATLDDLYRVKGKAELIGGRIVHLMATGRKPNRVAFRIARSLDDFAERIGRGEAYTDNIGFAVPVLSSGRESFSPDASYFVGPFPDNEMRFLEGPPTLAVEVRSENDYGGLPRYASRLHPRPGCGRRAGGAGLAPGGRSNSRLTVPHTPLRRRPAAADAPNR